MMVNIDQTTAAGVLKVLVVDDMPANRAVLCRRLELFSYATTAVDSGAAALEYLSENRPDIVLLDYMMPKMNGIEVLHRLRADPKTEDLPVIMVTARAESEATVDALAAGADDYISKPIDYEVLQARIERHVSRKSDTSELRQVNAVLDERMTMRNLVLADLEEELKQEIGRRKELETRLEALRSGSGNHEVSGVVAEKAIAIEKKFSAIYDQAISGKTLNMALVHETKEMIEELVRTTNSPA